MPIITLLTDFGVGSPYVAAMKGVILSINPAATLVDISHEVPPQDIRRGALILEDAARWFPPDTIHLAVVDPGVGTQRAIVYARCGQQQYIAPDNGLLSRVARSESPTQIVRLSATEFWRQPVSVTFHGRDIMSPVAAQLSLGLDPARLGPPQFDLVMLSWPEVRASDDGLEGHVLWIDSFGNLITDITRAMLSRCCLSGEVCVECRGRQAELVNTYAERPPGTLVALFGSSDRLELAVVGSSAASMIAASANEPVSVRWHPR